MGKINMQKVLIGGLIAGVFLNIVDYVQFGVVLKDQMAAAMQAINKPAMTNAQIPYFVVLDLVAGVFLVWLYAAIRPRFGAGPVTAAKAATVVGLVSWTLAAVIGAKFYTEGAGVGAGMGAGMGARM